MLGDFADKFIDIERLCNIVIRTSLHGLHCVINGTKGCDYDHCGGLLALTDFCEDLQAAFSRHTDIQYGNIKGRLPAEC